MNEKLDATLLQALVAAELKKFVPEENQEQVEVDAEPCEKRKTRPSIDH